ncbi:MAG: polyphosphate:AMP phosphotransferase [Gammaproteobacteria bacterium]|nr:MAG: polyphosphate:AMP phosphotransferase [Gammaproteobacteria bacterium]
MFESAELGQKISKDTFKELEPELRTRLLQAQQAIQSRGIPVIILLSGVEGSDRSGVVKRLNKWFDPRYLRTYAFWDETDEERERPLYWRFWRCLPQRGETNIMFGSWYTRPIIDRVFEHCDDAQLQNSLQDINMHERMLCHDNHIIIKLWFHISHKTQLKRLAKKKRFGKSPTAALFQNFAKNYDNFIKVSEQAISSTDTAEAPWHIIEATDKRYRDINAARVILEMIENRLATMDTKVMAMSSAATEIPLAKTVLDRIKLDQSLHPDKYEKQLAHFQKKLARQVWDAYDAKRSIILLFEGWDAAGKGGAIRRITSAIDARLYKVIPIAAPSDEEKAHHYLWRFWRHIPRRGYLTIYDRSWYGRVLVERVEGFATTTEWQRAYQEINFFEEQLSRHGIILCKFWLHISAEEQLRRFREREQTPWKQHKITEEDWRNREKWPAYEQAIHDMVSRTSTAIAPWTVVSANDKLHGRMQILKNLSKTIEDSL